MVPVQRLAAALLCLAVWVSADDDASAIPVPPADEPSSNDNVMGAQAGENDKATQEAEAKKLAEGPEARKLEGEAEDLDKELAEEAGAKKLAEEAEAKKLADEADAKKLVEEAEAKKLAEEAESKKLAEEAEAKKLVEDAEAKNLVEEADAKKLAEEAEAKKVAEEAEVKLPETAASQEVETKEADAKKSAEEAEAKKLAEEAEAKKLAEEAEAKKLADDADSKKLAEEADAKKLAEEAEAKKLAEEAEAKKSAEQVANQEAEAKKLADDTTISNLQAQVANLENDKSTQEATMSSLREQVDALSKDKASLEKDKSSLEQDARNSAEQITEEQSKVTSMTATISDLNFQIKTKAEENDKTQAIVNSISTDLQKSKEQVVELQGALATSGTKVDELIDKHKVFEQEATTAQNELTKVHFKLHREHELLQAQYADPSIQHFLHAKAVKVYTDPGIQGARNKTFIYVMPTLENRYEKSMKFMHSSESLVYNKLNAYVGTEKIEPWLPAVSGTLVYGGVIFPFICTVCCLTRIVCKMRPLLLFCHLDFFLTTLCAGMFAFYTGKEPLAAFAHHDASVYLFTQAMFGLAFCMYFLLLCLAFCRAKSGTNEGLYRFAQILGAAPIAIVYYKHVWTPAMLDEMPHIQSLVAWMAGEGAIVSHIVFVPYVPVSALFLLLLYLERLCSLAAASGPMKADGEDEMSVVMRNDVELAVLIGGQGSSTSSNSEKLK